MKLKTIKGLKMPVQEKPLRSMSVSEVVDGIGRQIITKELGGTILIATLKEVNCKSDGSCITSIKVDENGETIVWPTQWMQAVFV